jgi:hypothetical protein
MARFTTADFTPSWAESIVCMLRAQDAQDIPSTGYISLTVGTWIMFYAKLRQIQPQHLQNIPVPHPPHILPTKSSTP